MKLFADSSYLGNAYYAGGAFEAVARRTRQNVHPIIVSVAVLLEFRLGSLWKPENEKGWKEFESDRQAGKILQEPVEWNEVFFQFGEEIVKHGKSVRPDLLDGLHVLAAQQRGATHFLSFDVKSRQRAFARALGLKLVPEKLSGEN